MDAITIRYWQGIAGGTAASAIALTLVIFRWHPSVWIKAPVLVALAVLLVRCARMRVVCDAGGLTAHNIWITYRLPWREVTGFELTWYSRVAVCKADGRRRLLDGIMSFGQPIGPTKKTLKRYVDQLEEERERRIA